MMRGPCTVLKPQWAPWATFLTPATSQSMSQSQSGTLVWLQGLPSNDTALTGTRLRGFGTSSSVWSVNSTDTQQHAQESHNVQRGALQQDHAPHHSSASPTAQAHMHAGIQLHQGLRKGAAIASSFASSREYAKQLSSYDPQYAESVSATHKAPRNLTERLAYNAILATRSTFDYVTGYRHDKPQTEAQWLRRMIFLETVAGVPGMCAGMLRHLRSLRTMKRDQGWINTLLEEAENERMHLLTFMEMRRPGTFFRTMVVLAQGVYFNIFFISYLLAPGFCHALVGYLEEEAVKTYTHALQDIDAGHLWKDRRAPDIAIQYWKLSPEASMRELILAVRADEACHAHVNHQLSEIKPDDRCPFAAEDPSIKQP